MKKITVKTENDINISIMKRLQQFERHKGFNNIITISRNDNTKAKIQNKF